MGDGRRGTTAPLAAGLVVGALGGSLSLVHLAHGAAELGETPLAVLTGAVLPFLVSIAILAGGVWVTRTDWDHVSPWRVVLWIFGGIVVAEVLAGLLYSYQASHGVYLAENQFVVAIHVSYGALVGLVVGIYDARAQETRGRLSHKSQRLDNFASIVSHDLRNPLNVVEGRVELAQETGDVSELTPLDAAIDRMRTIIRETLTLARQGDDALDIQPLSLENSARAAWTVIEAEDTTLAVDTNGRIRADPDRLRALFENLFRNAVEHTEGAVTVHVGDLTDEAGFFVADTGPGIPPDHRERIFEGGYSLDPEGTGLGLAIVRAVADGHGWSITVTEAENGGARFEFTNVATP